MTNLNTVQELFDDLRSGGDQYAPPSIVAGDLHVPFNAHPGYYWWLGGQSVIRTLAELNAPPPVWRRYAAERADLLTGSHAPRCSAGVIEQAGVVAWCGECGYFAVKE